LQQTQLPFADEPQGALGKIEPILNGTDQELLQNSKNVDIQLLPFLAVFCLHNIWI
jgi:hypothetical protein